VVEGVAISGGWGGRSRISEGGGYGLEWDEVVDHMPADE